MYKQLAALFARYISAHLKAEGKPHAFYASDGQIIGAIDLMTVAGGHIRVAGWSGATEVVLHMNGFTASARPDLLRDDVAQTYGLDAHLGFDFSVPLGPFSLADVARLGIVLHGADPSQQTIGRPLPIKRIRWIQMRILFTFVWLMLIQTPSAIGWLATRDPKYRARIKQGLRLTTAPTSLALDPALFRENDSPSPFKPDDSITIIMPVFNAFDLLQDALRRIKDHTDLSWRLILVEDASTDSRVLPFLREWKTNNSEQVILLENKENLGFIRSVNRAFEQALLWTNPVVLLNSDALVPANWASRLIAPIKLRKHVATVTPMSNNAEVFSVPLICQPQELTTRQGDIIDQTAASLNQASGLIETPTGVGFCMAINFAYLAKNPSFDTVYGRGYGEEVDWCQRVKAMGGQHLSAGNLFVEHRGGESFGSEKKQQLIAENNRKVRHRFPHFDNDVQRFIQSDPLRSTRLALSLAWLGAQDAYPVSIYLAHCMGGGAEAYLANRITTKHHALGRSAVILRVGGKQRWQIELVTPDGTTSGHTDSLDYVLQMLAPIARRRIIYSCGVGDSDPASLPDALYKLSNNGRHTIEVLVHDYFIISPSYTLLDDAGIYHGVPTVHDGPDLSDSQKIPLQDWQKSWSYLLDHTKDIITFSSNSAEIVKTAYPAISDKISINPHQLLQQVPVIQSRPTHTRRVIGVLGDIGLQKGAGLIHDLALTLDQNDIGLAIIGNFDAAYPIPSSIPVHGRYQIESLQLICDRYGITDWLIPSIWPETFSFTTHEALATGLPVHAFDLGAQGDAVSKANNGFPIPFTKGEHQNANLKDHFRKTPYSIESAA